MKLASNTAEGPGSETMRRYVNGATTPDEYLREVRKETEREVQQQRSDDAAEESD